MSIKAPVLNEPPHPVGRHLFLEYWPDLWSTSGSPPPITSVRGPGGGGVGRQTQGVFGQTRSACLQDSPEGQVKLLLSALCSSRGVHSITANNSRRGPLEKATQGQSTQQTGNSAGTLPGLVAGPGVVAKLAPSTAIGVV